jgi:cysteine desulfurase
VAFHTDAVQAFGRVRVRVDETACDLLSLSAHKLGGPKGMGALYVRDGVRLEPLVYGGGQERDLRPGTENVAGAVGLALAAELAAAEQVAEAARLGALRDRFHAGLSARIDGIEIHGGGGARVPHILNVGLPSVDQDAVLVALDVEGVAVSSGSACHSGAMEPSHVLVAMGRDAPDTASVRFSLGRTTTAEEVERVIEVVARVVERSRAIVGS